MKNLSVQEKEQNIISTIICCSEVLNFNNKNNYVQLYENIIGLEKNSINSDNNLIKNFNKIKYTEYHKNQLAYFINVDKYLKESIDNNDTSEIITNLNESLIQNEVLDIFNFKKMLSDKIIELLKNNDFDKYDSLDSNIIKTKIFAKTPLYVYGFDILNNQLLIDELKAKFNADINNLISIIFDKTNKDLLFIFNGNIIVYTLQTNNFDFYSNVYNNHELNLNILNDKNYLSLIKEHINQNMLEIYKNISLNNFKFTDNLFSDNKKTEIFSKEAKYRNDNMFVKS